MNRTLNKHRLIKRKMILMFHLKFNYQRGLKAISNLSHSLLSTIDLQKIYFKREEISVLIRTRYLLICQMKRSMLNFRMSFNRTKMTWRIVSTNTKQSKSTTKSMKMRFMQSRERPEENQLGLMLTLSKIIWNKWKINSSMGREAPHQIRPMVGLLIIQLMEPEVKQAFCQFSVREISLIFQPPVTTTLWVFLKLRDKLS